MRKKIRDSVPKAITLKLVNKVQATLQSSLITELYDPAVIDELLEETPEIIAQREQVA